jgi:hypothetical protein
MWHWHKKKYLWFYYCLYETKNSLPENSKLKKLKLRSAARAIRLSGSTRGLLLSTIVVLTRCFLTFKFKGGFTLCWTFVAWLCIKLISIIFSLSLIQKKQKITTLIQNLKPQNSVPGPSRSPFRLNSRTAATWLPLAVLLYFKCFDVFNLRAVQSILITFKIK